MGWKLNLPLNASNSTDSHILIPQLPLSKAHDILLCNGSYHTLDLFGAHATSSSDDLSSNIFCHGSGAVKGKEY
jgi:hypothetical protein